MTTTGITNWGYALENDEIIREAWERCGRSGSTMGLTQAHSALRSMNLLFVEWANRGINLFAVEQQQITLLPMTNGYTLPVDTIRVLNVVIQGPLNAAPQMQDLMISPISRAEWFALPDKLYIGERPTQYYLERTMNPILYLWPVQQMVNYRVKYYRLRASQDVGELSNTPEAANRWLDAICAGTAQRMAVKEAPERFQLLDAEYQKAFQFASEEDVEHVTFRYAPDMSVYYEH